MNINLSNKNKLKKVVLSVACASMAICGVSQSVQAAGTKVDCKNHSKLGSSYIGLASNFGKSDGSLFIPNSIGNTGETRTNQYLMEQKSNYCDWAVLFGGELELDQQEWSGTIAPYLASDKPATAHDSSGKGVYLTNASLNTFANFGKYLSAFTSLVGTSYDSVNYTAANSSDRIVEVDNALVLMGNLDEFPVYGFVGLSYLPFGDFTDISGYPILGLNAVYFYGGNSYEQAGVGFDKYGLNVTAAIVTDPQDSMTTSQNFDNFAVNALYHHDFGKMGLRLGAGFLKDVQRTKLMWFRPGTSGMTAIDNTPHNLPAGSLTAELSFNNMFSLRADYAQILKNADYGLGDPKPNKHKKPGSLTLQGLFQAPLAGRLTVFRLLYSTTREMRGVPGGLGSYDMTAFDPKGLKSAWQVMITRAIFSDNFLVSVDYQRTNNYNGQHANLFTLDELIEW